MNKIFGIFILCIFSLSCSSDLDFDQVNNIKLQPVIEANLANFDITANDFVINGVEQRQISQIVNFDVFKDAFFNENLNRADFFFEFNNTINRNFRVSFVFMDDNNTRLQTITIDVPAYNGVEKLVTETEIFEKANLNNLKKTTKIAFMASIIQGSNLNQTSLGSLKMRSSGTLYLIVE